MFTNEKTLGKNNQIMSNLYQPFICAMLFLSIAFLSFYIGERNYLIFHITVEFFSSVIAFCIFLFSINTYRISKNIFLIFIGVAYGFVGGFDLVHMITFKGMNVFKDLSLDIPTQLWISARYIEAISVLLSYRICKKNRGNTSIKLVFGVYALISLLILLSIFRWNVFPKCFIEGEGLTSFKIISEYIICFITGHTIYLFYKERKNINGETYTMIMGTLISTIISELSFTLYSDPYGNANMIGHLFKGISFYFVYKSVIKSNLQQPYKLLFDKLEETNEKLYKENCIRKNMEEILVKNQECCKLLITNSKDSILVHSGGRFIFANKKAANMLGYDKVEELIGKCIEDYIPEREKIRINNIFNYIYKNKITMPFYESQAITSNGKIIDIETSATFLIYQDKPAILGVLRDMTPKKQVEMLIKDVETNKRLLDETQEFNKLITEFFSNISHELKTPINVILGAIQVTELYNKNGKIIENIEKVKGYSKSIKQNCYRLLRLVNNLIDISKIDSGYLKPKLQNLNIISVVEEIALSIADYVKDKGVNLIFDTDEEERIMAIDPDKVERVMLNLLSNAVKFTNPGDEILVSVVNRKESVILSVKDTGVGIPEDKLLNIFERFSQVDKTIKRNREGSGIGLSLVKSIVEMHNGTIDIVSVFDKGSEFIIELPVTTVINDVEDKNHEFNMNRSNIERISIEFSDIYY